MKIKYLRWGYDGGGFGCGPIEGNSVVEIMAAEDDGKLVFSTASSNGEGIDFKISDMPLFDILINIMDDDIDFEHTLSKVEEHSLENYGAIWDEDVPEELLSSKYSDLLAVTFAALQHYMRTPEDSEVLPEEYIQSFMDSDGNIANIPVISFYEDWDEEDEE